jgi:hypothetical protein
MAASFKRTVKDRNLVESGEANNCFEEPKSGFATPLKCKRFVRAMSSAKRQNIRCAARDCGTPHKALSKQRVLRQQCWLSSHHAAIRGVSTDIATKGRLTQE